MQFLTYSKSQVPKKLRDLPRNIEITQIHEFPIVLKAEELRGYFKGLGAEIAAERSDKGIDDDLHKIIGVSDSCFKDNANVTQIEEVLNGIVSMLALVSIGT